MFTGPNIIRDGLVLHLDAANQKSFRSGATTWFDLSGRGNNGTLTNGPTFNSANGGSIVFDGVNDRVLIPTSTTYKVQFPLTVCLTYKITSLSPYTLIETDNPTNSYHAGVAIGVSATGYGVTYGNNTQNNSPGRRTYLSPSVPVVGNWYNIVAVLPDNLNLSFYINGQLTNSSYSSGTTTTLAYSSGDASLGFSYDVVATSFFNGSIANFQIYNRALTASEILQNYNATKSRFNL